MVIEIEFAVKIEAQISPNRFEGDNRAFYGSWINREIGRVLSSCKVKKFSFVMLHDESSIEENFEHNCKETLHT